MVQSNHWDTTSQMASHQLGLAFQVPTKTAWRLEILLMILGISSIMQYNDYSSVKVQSI